MRWGAHLLWAGMLLGLAAVAGAADKTVASKEPPKDPAPWHIVKVAKGDAARREATTAATDTAPRKYLHVRVAFRTANGQRKHEFRIVTARGGEVGELWGWNAAKSLVIFEGDWKNLRGLYLDGNGHREPLLPPLAKKPSKATDKPDQPDKRAETPAKRAGTAPEALEAPAPDPAARAADRAVAVAQAVQAADRAVEQVAELAAARAVEQAVVLVVVLVAEQVVVLVAEQVVVLVAALAAGRVAEPAAARELVRALAPVQAA